MATQEYSASGPYNAPGLYRHPSGAEAAHSHPAGADALVSQGFVRVGDLPSEAPAKKAPKAKAEEAPAEAAPEAEAEAAPAEEAPAEAPAE